MQLILASPEELGSSRITGISSFDLRKKKALSRYP